MTANIFNMHVPFCLNCLFSPQVIFAEEIGPNIATFGFSVSGGYDLDENMYSDLLVGAYESNTAIHFP